MGGPLAPIDIHLAQTLLCPKQKLHMARATVLYLQVAKFVNAVARCAEVALQRTSQLRIHQGRDTLAGNHKRVAISEGCYQTL